MDAQSWIIMLPPNIYLGPFNSGSNSFDLSPKQPRTSDNTRHIQQFALVKRHRKVVGHFAIMRFSSIVFLLASFCKTYAQQIRFEGVVWITPGPITRVSTPFRLLMMWKRITKCLERSRTFTLYPQHPPKEILVPNKRSGWGFNQEAVRLLCCRT